MLNLEYLVLISQKKTDDAVSMSALNNIHDINNNPFLTGGIF